MGGVINVAIRFRDGRAVCQNRWTNNMPYWFKRSRFFDGDEQFVQAYINMTRKNAPSYKDEHGFTAPGAPEPVRNSEYGIIVWDFMTNTIIDNNHYSHPINMEEIEAVDSKIGNFAELALSGRIKLRQYIKKAGEGKYNRYEHITDIVSPEAAFDHALRINMEERIGWISEKKEKKEPVDGDVLWENFVIDPKPMTYFNFGDHGERGNWKKIREKLEEINFPMSKKAGLNSDMYRDSTYDSEDGEFTADVQALADQFATKKELADLEFKKRRTKIWGFDIDKLSADDISAMLKENDDASTV